jgi:hypothetical protein
MTDLTGRRFGRLVVTGPAGEGKWHCVCDCGGQRTAHRSNLGRKTLSCGCLHRERITRHGRSRTKDPTLNAWRSMMSRCYTPGSKYFKNYGGRGIVVCERWRGPDGFTHFLADMGERPAGVSLDRINNNGNYEPGNCRWADGLTQHNNKRTNRLLTHRGVTMTVAEWARAVGLGYPTLQHRLQLGWSVARALESPVRRG